ncbi:alpha/beta hydrolase [Pseudomonas paraveronii]|jgi:pimeloyl-ACP methyl ester carboxylesterase|uniref:alpha/beta fold hydrolase n=1 Tax=Pseudomonas paraveronii TaxID=3040598 RepID=UPI002AAF65C4|nr:alpha/beta hydrolase [Pseudomonas sp. FLM 11]
MTKKTNQSCMEMWVKTNRGNLYAKSWPGPQITQNQPPIVLLHDSLGSTQQWRDFPMRLADATGHPVIAYDRLGFGKSDPHPGLLGASFISDEAKESFSAVIEQLSIGRFIVFGHSVGGGMAVSIARAYPDQCQAIITESAQSFVEDRTLDGILVARDSFSDPSQMKRLEKHHGSKAKWVLDAWVNTWHLPEFSQWCLDEDLPLVRCPILAIHGENDEYGSSRHPKRIVALAEVPVRFECLSKCGHVPHREQEKEVLDAIRSFIEDMH